MKLRLRIYPPLWFLVFAAAGLALQHYLPLPLTLGENAEYAAMVLAASGFLFAGAAIGLFRRAGTTVDPFGESRLLVIAGPYRITRNPMYLGLLLTLSALVLWLQSLPGLLLPLLFVWVITHRHIIPEERRLEHQFGLEYRNYLSRTRRWI